MTLYIYDCFKHLSLARFLYCQTPNKYKKRSGDGHRIADLQTLHIQESACSAKVNVGDVVAVKADMKTWMSDD